MNTLKIALGWVGKAAAYAVMGLFSLMTIYPVIWLIYNSFKTNAQFMVDKISLPNEWILSNYVGAWTLGTFDMLIGNSVIFTVLSALGIILISVLAGFGFAKMQHKSTGPIYGSFVMGILLSITSLMVPLFIQVSQLDRLISDAFHAVGLFAGHDVHVFYNTGFGVILIYVGSGLPMAVYLCTEYIKSIPTSLVEAARIDGATYFSIFWRIILPMSTPIATTIAVINVPGLWNEFALINILVSDETLKTLPLGILRFNGQRSVDYGKQFAALVIGMAPMLIFYFAFRKQITAGVSGGAVKG
ncbi:MAG: carbohydrate ABC transporter permease [Spirochaetales bacterium]